LGIDCLVAGDRQRRGKISATTNYQAKWTLALERAIHAFFVSIDREVCII
jgi:hypothetical protein